jgi:ribosomal protein S12 methylthiotransferase
MATNPKICKYIDIPLQHINDRVLSNMRRSIDGKGTRELIDSIRSKVPDVALRTTMIVGHPGETDRAFEQLIDFVKEYKFERLGAFTYSPEEGTWGDKNLKDSISKKVKQERFEKLMEVQSAISLEHNLARVGNIERVLVDSLSSDGILVARSIKESPEVDGEILIGSDNLLPKDYYTNLIGKFVNVSIESANEYDLLAKIV